MSTMPIPPVDGRISWLRAAPLRAAPLRAAPRAALLLPLLAALACGGGTKTANDPVSADKTEIAWKDKTRAQRMDWMGLQVFPRMKSAFKEFDESRFSGFACQTCHSDKMEMVDFRMPNDTIYALPLENTVQSAREYDEKVTDFMVNVVTPKMAELLDMPVYNPETKSGFGCFNCHPSEG